VLNYEELAKLYQPPYGDRAIVLKESQTLIGACGYVPCLDAFGQLPAFGAAHDARRGLTSTAFGLYWAVSPRYQRRGYAAEAAGALVYYAFTNLNLRRIIATTTHDNAASLGVMRKLGMRVERNPYPEPPWLQAVGVLDNPALAAHDEEQR
jgi:RimJ/RimL family protein N-acetyltransferase